MSESAMDATGASLNIADAIEKIKANPEIISAVASALGVGGTQSTGADSVEEKPEAEAKAPAEAQQTNAHATSGLNLGNLVSSLAPMLSTIGGAKGGGRSLSDKNREALLCALKPYVSEERREAIDYMIRISQISDMLKHLN